MHKQIIAKNKAKRPLDTDHNASLKSGLKGTGYFFESLSEGSVHGTDHS